MGDILVESRIITISTQAPDGPRKAAISGSFLSCRLFSRSNFLDAVSQNGDDGGGLWEWCDHPGIYLLTGVDNEWEMVYIGQADSVSERLLEHHRNPDRGFWHATAVLQHSYDELTAGNLDFLEAKLIGLASRAQASDRIKIANKVEPHDKNLAARERAESEKLLDQSLFLLPAVGLDFLCDRDRPQPDPAVVPGAPAQLRVPPNVEALLNRLRDALLSAGPGSEFYATRVDYRAKVVRDGHFRPFARLRLGKSAIVLRLQDVADFKLLPKEPVSDPLRQHIQQAYTLAVEYLDGKQSAATA